MEQENVLSALYDLQASAENMRVLEWPESSLENLHSVLEKCYPSYSYNCPVLPRSQSVNNNVSAAGSSRASRSCAKPKAISAGSFYGASGASSSTKSATEYGARASDDDDLDFKEDDIARPPARSKFSTEKAPVTRAYNTRHSNRNSSTRTQNVYEFDSLQGFSNEIRGKVESLISYHHLDATKELFIYPFQGKDCVTMMKNDLLRLEEGEFLNDTIIQFYLKYILDTTLAHRNHDTHIFSTFFYKKLSDKVHLKDLDKGYARVRKWTSKQNVWKRK
ncbi:hypothetical protein BKA69DRAFT_161357 [Paraphysoderma sedebokerense]|nr:hypothetical protein BKA69DRAFT_161357 [Paraphysoderma sedebokerense]